MSRHHRGSRFCSEQVIGGHPERPWLCEVAQDSLETGLHVIGGVGQRAEDLGLSQDDQGECRKDGVSVAMKPLP